MQQQEEQANVLSELVYFVTMLGKLEERWNYLYNEIGTANLKQSDLLHRFENLEQEEEFKKLKKYKRLKARIDLYKQLTDLRTYRRLLKNEKELLEPLYNWFCNSRKTYIDLHKTKEAMSRILDNQQNWIYIPRVQETENGPVCEIEQPQDLDKIS